MPALVILRVLCLKMEGPSLRLCPLGRGLEVKSQWIKARRRVYPVRSAPLVECLPIVKQLRIGGFILDITLWSRPADSRFSK